MRATGLVLIAITATGCMGEIGDPVDQGGAPLCSRPEPGPSPIRRMTRFEYDNTVRDLLGDTTRPAEATFVPDEEALGFNNNAYALGVTNILAEQYMTAAESLSKAATADMPTLLEGCDPATAGEDTCADEFVTAFGRRAWRRPLDATEHDRLLTLFRTSRDQWGFEEGIQLVIQAMLQSPYFLYRVEFGDPATEDRGVVRLTSWEVAARLSYLLWSSTPDDELLAAAEANQLSTPDEIEAQARRMLDDPKAREAVENFNFQWLKLERLDSMPKDTAVFPSWTPEMRNLFRDETRAFLDHIYWDAEDGNLWTMLTAPYSFMNADLAAFYGEDPVEGDAFVQVETDPMIRAGILTQGAILAVNAKPNQTSPVHRGKFVREQLLCQQLPPPPDDIDIVPPDLDPNLTTRERFSEHSTNPACSGCHHLMDPIGFGFEHYDGVGLWRDVEGNDLPIDASGEIKSSVDVDGEFYGVPELAHRLAASNQVRECVATQWFRYAYGRGETAADECSMMNLFERFAASGYNFQDLLVGLTLTDTFQYKRLDGGGL